MVAETFSIPPAPRCFGSNFNSLTKRLASTSRRPEAARAAGDHGDDVHGPFGQLDKGILVRMETRLPFR
ncbi:MAG: hypothetical protein IPI44_17795 [Sulfuritalea sp.]|nr:hypothetical protein [Sulfuritalea sp.]